MATEVAGGKWHEPDIHAPVTSEKNDRLVDIGKRHLTADEAVKAGTDEGHDRRVDESDQSEGDQQADADERREQCLGQKNWVDRRDAEKGDADPDVEIAAAQVLDAVPPYFRMLIAPLVLTGSRVPGLATVAAEILLNLLLLPAQGGPTTDRS